MKNIRTELKIGIITMGLALTLRCLFPVPELLVGFLLAASICLEVIGALPETAYQKIKTAKRRWLQR